MSVGINDWDGSEPAATLLARADEALYAAKRAGRDRVEWRSAPDRASAMTAAR